MSVNSTMNALANILKPEGGPMDLETIQKTEEQKEEERKAYEARIEATKVPTPDELAARAAEVTARMTDFNCDFHPDERAKFEMRQVSFKLFNALVLSLPEKIDQEDPVWQRKTKEFLVALYWPILGVRLGRSKIHHPVQFVTMSLEGSYVFGRCILQIDIPALDYRTVGQDAASKCSISCSRYIDPHISAPDPTKAWLETDVH
ncbi:hypothetical protein HD553DRAFT_337198, partial [Filobasidium floriforme]|uniref:uncharacterized protein n=1 Tax=Filobasidium floriforme TaxID=5210 RepID=UPI001E8D1AEC